jgi:hypothetical protein
MTGRWLSKSEPNPSGRPKGGNGKTAFLDRVMRMTLYLAVFIAWVLLSLGRNREAASFLIGAALGLGMLWTLRFAVSEGLSGKRTGWKKKAFAGAVGVAKYAVAGVAIWWFIRWPSASITAFVAGAAMTQIVLLLKALGTLLSPPDLRDPYST